MTTPLRPCGRRECRLCNRRAPIRQARPFRVPESLALALVGLAAIVAVGFALLVILPLAIVPA